MAFALDDVVQRVLLEGDDQILAALEKIAEKGGEFFEDLAKAAKGGNGSLEALATAIGAAESALAAATAAMIAFVENSDAAIVNLSSMAQAFGTTTTSMQGIEGAFAAAGIASTNMARVVQRVATAVGNDWAEIQKNVKNSALESEKSMVSMQEASLRVKEAQDNLANGGADRSARMTANNIQVANSFVKLQFAAQEAASLIQKNFSDVEGATLGVMAAEQRLATLQGRPPSEAEKHNLEIKQAELAVEKALAAQQEASRKQIEDLANAQAKQQEIALAYANARRKQAEDEEKALIEERQQVLALQNARIAQAEAAEKAHENDLRDIPKIVNAINALGTAARGTADGINVAEVSVANLTKGLIAAAQSGAAAPTGFDVLKKLADTFQADADHVISNSERLAVATHLAGGTMRNAFGPELVRLLENGGAQFEKMAKKAEELGLTISDSDIKAAREFRVAMTELGVDLDLTKDKLAAAASPVFTAFLHAIDESLTSSSGVLHTFVDGLRAIGSIISSIGSGISYLGGVIDKAFGEGSGLLAGKLVLGALLVLVGLFAAPILAWPVIIALVVTALGAVYDKFQVVKDFFSSALANIKAGFASVGDFIAGGWITMVQAAINKLLDKMGAVGKFLKSLGGSGGTEGNSAVAPIPALAGGGHIHGPGTGTSDSILARVSDGEHVTKAAAVSHYGRSFMDAVNNMTLPAFAMGGFVGAPQRLATASPNTNKPGATLNLSIDGNHFNGLHAPEDVASRLQSFAISRQLSSTGRAPSWKA